jgi:hypothetical protein
MCIANYPDKNIPTLLIYRKGGLIRQVIGLGAENGLKGMKTGVVGEFLLSCTLSVLFSSLFFFLSRYSKATWSWLVISRTGSPRLSSSHLTSPSTDISLCNK